MVTFLFYLLSVISIFSVIAMIFSRHQAYNALFLAVAFTSLGGLFALLNAPFIAAVQIIIYAGAIMVLFIFVIMMIDLRQPFPPLRKKWVYALGTFLMAVIFIELLLVIKSLPKANQATSPDFGHPTALGKLLFSKYLYPFEITSVLIVVAIVGSLYLARRKERG